MLLHHQHLNETPPVERSGPIATTRPPLPLGAPARAVGVLAELRAGDDSPAEQVRQARAEVLRNLDRLLNAPLLQVDFAAWLTDDWTHVKSDLDNLDDATAREFARWSAGAEYAPRVLFAPLLSELTELVSVQLPEVRKALAGHAEDELAWIDAEMVVAL